MHHSRLGGIIIDCQIEDLAAAAEFWRRALGYRIRTSLDPVDSGYLIFDTAEDELHIEVQKVDHPSRVHLDIETDDVEAEVRRLEALGARCVRQVHDWWVMEAPTGHRFCVVRAQGSSFAEEANRWED